MTPTPDPIWWASRPGHYAIGLRDGGSSWHIGIANRRECPTCFDDGWVYRTTQPAPALDVGRLADAEHRWCVEVEGEFALGHSPDSHRRQATFILARLSGDPA